MPLFIVYEVELYAISFSGNFRYLSYKYQPTDTNRKKTRK